MKAVAGRQLLRWLMIVGLVAACDGSTTNPDDDNDPPTLAIAVTNPTATLEQGGTADIPVTITRGGSFIGPVTVTVTGLPNTVTASPTNISSGLAQGTIVLSAAANAPPGASTVTVRANGPGVTESTATFTLNTTVKGGYTLAATPAAATVAAGASAQSTIAITRVGGFAATVELAATAPAGLTATLTPTSLSTATSSALNVAVASTVPAGTYNVTVTGTTTGLANQTATFAVTVSSGGGFTLSSTTPTLQLAQGATGTSTINVTRTGGYTAAVALTSAPPAGITVSFNPASVTGTTSTASITVGAGVAAGTYPVVVNGNGTGATQQTTTISVTVPTTAPTPSVSLAVVPSPIAVVAGNTGAATLTVTRLGGFTGAVALTADAAPAGITVAMNPTSIATGSTTSSITISAASTVAAGSYNVTLRANGTGITEQTVTVPVTVTAAPGTLGIAATPSPVTVVAGASGTTTLTATRGGSFSGAVALTADAAPAGITVSFAPTSIASGATTSVITVSAAGTVAAGSYNITVRANGTGVTEQVLTIPVTVTAAGGFTMAVAPTAVSIASGAAGTSTVTLTRTNGFAGAVALTATAPAGLTVTFTPSSVTGTTSTVNIAVAGSVAAGTQNVTIRANATGLAEQTVVLPVTVTAGSIGSGNVRFQFCGRTGTPLFVAARNGTSAPWQAVTSGGDGSYSFQVDGLGSLAYVVPTGDGGFATEVYQGTATELNRQGAGSCSTGGSKTVNSTLTAAPGALESVVAYLGGSQATITGTNMVFRGVSDGPLDLIGSRSALNFGTFNRVPDRFVLRRSQNIANNGTLAPIDFGAGTTPVQATATVNNLAGGPSDIFLVTSILLTSNNSFGYLGETIFGGAGSRPWFGFPANVLQDGDLHQISAAASNTDVGSLIIQRLATTYSSTVKDVSVTLGPVLTTPTVAVAGTSPYARLRATYSIQPQYASQFIVTFQQSAGAIPRRMNVTANTSFTGASTAVLEVPDLSGVAGWNNTWGLVTGVSTSYNFTANSYDPTLARPTDGYTFLTGSQTGTITP